MEGIIEFILNSYPEIGGFILICGVGYYTISCHFYFKQINKDIKSLGERLEAKMDALIQELETTTIQRLS